MKAIGADGNAGSTRAMAEEALLLRRATLSWRKEDEIVDVRALLKQAAACLFAAALGSAQRFVREHPDFATDELRRLADLGDQVAAKLPNELQLLWTVRYAGGHPLEVYAVATGLSDDDVLADYREMARVLVGITHKVAEHARKARGLCEPVRLSPRA